MGRTVAVYVKVKATGLATVGVSGTADVGVLSVLHPMIIITKTVRTTIPNLFIFI